MAPARPWPPVVLALPALGTRFAASPQRLSVPGATQIAAILGPAPMGVAAIRLR